MTDRSRQTRLIQGFEAILAAVTEFPGDPVYEGGK